MPNFSAILAQTGIAALVLLAQAHAAEGDPDQRFSRMQVAFEKGAFREAEQIGEGLLKEKHLSPQLFHLLGNIRYRQGDPGRAALWYERAELFPPPAPETRQNLAHVHDRTGNFLYPHNGVAGQFSAWLSRTQWFQIAAVCAWAAVFTLVTGFVFSRAGNFRALCVTLAVIALTGGTLAALGWFWHPSFEKIRDIAVVTAPQTSAYTAATVTGGSVVALPPGSQVRVIDDRGTWCYVEVPAGIDHPRGWVRRSALTPFWPFDATWLE